VSFIAAQRFAFALRKDTGTAVLDQTTSSDEGVQLAVAAARRAPTSGVAAEHFPVEAALGNWG